MSAQDLIDPSFKLSSIFPNLAFDGLSISSGSQFGFCNKFLFKNNTFVFGDFSIKMTDYSFEQVHLSLDSGANNKREIQVEHGKIKIHLLTTQSINSNSLNSNLKLKFNSLDIDLCINDETFLTIHSQDSTIDIEKQKNLEMTLSSCQVYSANEEILKKSYICIKINKDNSTFQFSSDLICFNCPISITKDLFKKVYSILNSMTLSFNFTKIQAYINKDTFIIANNFSLVYNANQYKLTSRNCYFHLSSFVFLFKDILINEKGFSIQDLEFQRQDCSFQRIQPSTDPFLTASYANETEFNMTIHPIESSFDLIQFELFLDRALMNSFLPFFFLLYSDSIVNINFREIQSRIKINDRFTFSFAFDATISIQNDSMIITSTGLTYHFNNNPPISSKQVFQYVRKNTSEGTKGNATLLLSPLKFNFSGDEISPFIDLINRIKNPLVAFLFKKHSETTIEMNEVFISIGQTLRGSNERSNFIRIKLEEKQVQLVADSHGLISVTLNPMIFVEFYNPLTGFWDSIVQYFNAHVVLIRDKQMKHVSITVDPQLSLNISTLFLSSLVNVLQSPKTSHLPMCLISNYTDAPIGIYEQNVSSNKITLQPSQSHPLLHDTFYFPLNDKKILQMYTTCITTQFFLTKNLLVNVELKEGLKNIYFMSLWSVENKLGANIRLFHKVKRSMVSFMDLKINEKKGLPSGLNWTLNYSIGSMKHDKCDPNNTFIAKKYKFINYTIKNLMNGQDADSLIILSKSKKDKTKVLTIHSRYHVKNCLPIAITPVFHHIKANSTLTVGAHSEKPLLMPCDLNQPFEITLTIGQETSKPIVMNLKDISKQMEYDVQFSQCGIKLNVYISENIPSFYFQFSSPMIICNRSSMSFTIDKYLLQSSKTYSLPLIDYESFPAILINDISKGPPVIAIPATSVPVQIPMKNVTHFEKSSVLKLPMTVDPNFVTLILTTIKKVGDIGYMIYLDDYIIIKNNTKRSITIRITNEFALSFPPNLHASISMANVEEVYQLDICNYKLFSNVYFTYFVDTVLRFVSDIKKNPHSKNELHIRMTVTENENKSKTVEFSEATIESSPYLIVNDTSHFIYAQQTDEWLPMIVKPYSGSICAFDDPFSDPRIMLIIEGKSIAVNYSGSFFNTPLPFLIADEFLYITVRTIETGQRVIFVNEKKCELYYDYQLTITIPQSILAILNNRQELIMNVIVGPTKFNTKTENGHINGDITIKFLQALDNTEKVPQSIVFTNEIEEKSNFIHLTFMMPITESISLSKIMLTSVETLPVCIQINKMFINEILSLWKETKLSIKTLLSYLVHNHLPVFLNSLSISPIKFDLFYRKDVTETVFIKPISSPHQPIQSTVPSLSTGAFPSISLMSISSTFNQLYDLIFEIYQSFLFKFFSCIKGKSVHNDTISFPHSAFHQVYVNKSDVLYPLNELVDLDQEELGFSHKRISYMSIPNDEELMTHSDSSISLNNCSVNNSSTNFTLLDSVNNSSTHFNSPFGSTPHVTSIEGDFTYIRDETQINMAYNKMPKKIEYQKYFFLKRLVQIDRMFINNLLSTTKKKKSIVLIQALLQKDSYLVVFDDCYDIIGDDGKSNVQFSSIQEVNRENNVVKITLIPEKPKLPPKIVELSLDTNHTAETVALIMNSQKERLHNK